MLKSVCALLQDRTPRSLSWPRRVGSATAQTGQKDKPGSHLLYPQQGKSPSRSSLVLGRTLPSALAVL